MNTPSKKQIEANRRNAMRSTGPKSESGKANSRRNALKHGFSAEVLVPEEGRAAFESAMARWTREAGPDNVVEEHLIRRAAVASVTLDRIDQARESTREETAREAVKRWAKKQQARARRTAQDLAKDPANTVLDLESTAFGCDWLIRQWEALSAPLALGRAWDQRALARAHLLLGLPEGTPTLDADRLVRRLWILAAAAQPDKVAAPPRLPAEESLPTDPTLARHGLRQFIAEQVDRLEGLRDDSWEAVEDPERRAVVVRAAAADESAEGQLRHRYHRDADRSAGAAIRLFVNLRDRRRRAHLEIAREAKGCTVLRVPVGDGWWREVDSAPAPPGFGRIAPEAGSSASASRPDPLGSLAESHRPTTDDPEPSPTGDAARNEPISGPAPSTAAGRNPNQENGMRPISSGPSPDHDRRTDPDPGPSPAAQSPRLDPDRAPEGGSGRPRSPLGRG
jgi:hypothetical protein